MKSKYIFEEPHAISVSQVYVEANKELLLPAPSISLEAYPKFTGLTGDFGHVSIRFSVEQLES